MNTPWQIQHTAQTPSTNDLARQAILAAWHHNLPTPRAMYVADRQTAGRGQHGLAWESPVGGLYCSMIVDQIPPECRERLALAAGVAVVEALRQMSPVDAMLRWPNDIVVAGKKMGGILCEAVALGDRWAGIVGIGLNVNTRIDDLPSPLRPFVTSLAQATGLSISTADLSARLSDSLADVLDRLRCEGLAAIITRFAMWDALVGCRIRIQVDDRLLEGIARGINPRGCLVLESPAGKLHPLDRGTLQAVNGAPIRPH